ncbi:MAG TPA: hypothetical protein VK582_01755 [Pyrinomonadaceae bacterium]|nr:hypothetical protein [Pyrinomonadaceae bacterium]
MFNGWDTFFFLVGSSAGALIGLMFVVITLTAGQEPRRVSRGAPVYVTPIVFHFTIVLIVSAISAVPGLPPSVAAVIVGLCATTGLAYSLVTTIRLFRSDWEDPIPGWSDKFFYGILPTMIYVALAVTATAIPFSERKVVFAIGAIVLGLLLLGIRNAWDLATTLALFAHKGRH